MTEDFTSEFGSNLSQPGNITLGDVDDTTPVTQPYWPSVDDVAGWIPARTKVKGGVEHGTFSELTRPTSDAVLARIALASLEVLGKITPVDYTLPAGGGFNAPGSDYEQRVQGAIALMAAIIIEVGYFPEQIARGQSPVAVLQQLFDERIRSLIAEGELGHPGGMGEGASGAGDSPADCAYSFPDAAPGALVGWASRW